MRLSMFRAGLRVITTLAMLCVASPSHAQQNPAAPASPPATVSQPAAEPAPVEASPSARQATPDDAGAAADNSGRSLKTVQTTLHDLSPWSMFLSADIIVKAVMIGLALASVVT